MNLAHVATTVAETLSDDSVVYFADDEQQAEALAAVLAALVPADQVFFVPSSDTLPGEDAPASPANAGRRVATLRALRRAVGAGDKVVCVLSGEAAARRYPSPEAFDGALPMLRAGDAIDLSTMPATLADTGYVADDRVDEPGEMAIRGDVIDIYPADAVVPARIEMVDGCIAAIRSYDPLTQRTIDELTTLEIGRATEPTIVQPFSILGHVPPGRMGMSEKADRRRHRFQDLAADVAERSGRPLDALEEDAWTTALSGWKPIESKAFEAVPRFAERKSPMAAFERFVTPLLEEGRSLVIVGLARDVRFLRARLAKRLSKEVVPLACLAQWLALGPGEIGMATAPIDAGFVNDRMVVVAAADLLGSRAILGDETSGAAAFATIAGSDFRIGDVVIHEDHGIGEVIGLEPAPAQAAVRAEMIVLGYHGGARRLVPTAEVDRIWRYGADAAAVKLDKLDGSTWLKRRGDVDAAIAVTARSLTELAAARKGIVAPVLDPEPAAYEKFVASFPFNETADQTRAISAVRADLASGRPMDRLVVGDVGYGKTEVALRAAALAALAGYQVVIAAPTTVLVRQHLETFRKRFAHTGLMVEGLSRLSSAREKKAVKASLADGSISVVIGTGAVMAKGVTYAKLGLVVIDEEQRFGAVDKARFRSSGDIHLLTLTATPIPRTLQMALVGLQQISVIASPPARRQPIRTSVDQFDEVQIRTALLREKGRGGQSFMVVPRIEDMAGCAKILRRIVPELALVEAHGKMPAAAIDEAMVGFAEGRGDVLLATNIIEAGLDVPRANTMIVWNADRFGLAQLHQLRGRVGRGHRRGQVMLLTDPEKAIGERTLKRLRTLAAFDRLGAGFEISARDLDMRGAGDLLGEEQAGHTKLIGVDLYQHLLGAALRKARGEEVDQWTPDLRIARPGAIPVEWIPSTDVRLSVYVRLARIGQEAELDALEDELIDRFGALPPQVEALLAQAAVRLSARAVGIERVDAGAGGIALTPRPDFVGDPDAVGMIKKDGRFLLKDHVDEGALMERVRTLLSELSAP